MTGLVLGATGTIGRCIALRFAERGHAVVAVGRRRETLDELRAALLAAGAAQVSVHAIDLAADPDAVERAFAAIAELQAVDVAVHAAGASLRGGVGDVSPTAWSEATAVKLGGAVALLTAVRRSGRGSACVVLVAGSDAFLPARDYALGCLNAAVVHLAKSAAQHFAPGIRVNAINPGPVEGGRLDARVAARAARSGLARDAARAALRDALPLRRFVEACEIADAVEFVAASPSMTGEVVSLSAGRAASAL